MSTTNKILICLIAVTLTLNLNAQIELPHKELKTDSLETALASHRKQDKVRLVLLNQLTNIYSKRNPRKGIETGQEAIALAQKIKDQFLLAEAYHNTGLNLAA